MQFKTGRARLIECARSLSQKLNIGAIAIEQERERLVKVFRGCVFLLLYLIDRDHGARIESDVTMR